MMRSTDDEFLERDANAVQSRRPVPAAVVALAVAAAGSLLALLIGLLTFGVQATVAPHHVPLAVGATVPGLDPLVRRVAGQGGDAVSWRTVSSRAEAERLLDEKNVYGVLLFSPGQSGPAATILLSGALNPSATQVAQPLLTEVASAVLAAARPQSGGAAAPPARVVILHPTSAAGRTLPLAASALLWLSTLAAGVLLVTAAPRLRGGRPAGRVAGLVAAAAAALFGTAVVLGLARAWDAGLPIGWDAAGFLALVGLAFGLLQTGVLRWLGLRGLAILAPLYLTAPAVAGLVPELLDPIYRDLLWSWTPFRFSTEGLRSLLFLGPGAADVQTAVWVFAAVAAAGLLLTIAPKPRRRPATTSPG